MTSEQFIQEMAELQGVDAVDFRAEVPEGTFLGKQDIEPGATANYFKPSSKMRMGNVALPDRVPLYDVRRHDISMVPPTIANRRITEYPGRFTMRKPANWHDSDPTPIEETCEVCLRDPERDPNAERPKFFFWDQLQEHYQLFHEFSWQRREREKAEQDRRDDRSEMRALIASLISVVRPDVKLPTAVQEQIDRIQQNAPAGTTTVAPHDVTLTSTVACNECGFEAKNEFGLNAHKRNKHKESG